MCACVTCLRVSERSSAGVRREQEGANECTGESVPRHFFVLDKRTTAKEGKEWGKVQGRDVRERERESKRAKAKEKKRRREINGEEAIRSGENV